MQNFDQWLSIATRDIDPDVISKLSAELKHHFEALCEQFSQSGADAEALAVQALGDPEITNKKYQEIYLTTKEKKSLFPLYESDTIKRNQLRLKSFFLHVAIALAFIGYSELSQRPYMEKMIKDVPLFLLWSFVGYYIYINTGYFLKNQYKQKLALRKKSTAEKGSKEAEFKKGLSQAVFLNPQQPTICIPSNFSSCLAPYTLGQNITHTTLKNYVPFDAHIGYSAHWQSEISVCMPYATPLHPIASSTLG